MAQIVRAESADVGDVERTWTQFVPFATLEHIDPDDFSFQWCSVALPEVAIVQCSLTATVHSRIRPEDQLLACRLVTGDGWVRSRQSSLEAGAPWASDSAQVEAKWRGTAEVSALVFDRVQAQDLARRITGDDLLSLRLTALEPRNRTAARYWTRAFDYLLASALAVDGDELIEANLSRHALVATLSCFASTYADAISRPRDGAGVQSVRRAVAFIDENAHRPITIDDVAAAAHISTRGLQYAFQRSLETTPTEYLRRVRLDGAHRDLRTGAANDTVARIARRWGFANPSRFATLYRQTYGRSPKQTLEQG